MKIPFRRITEFCSVHGRKAWLFAACFCLSGVGATAAQESGPTQREAFSRAWQAAARGDQAELRRQLPGLQGYLLYPYLQYEDLRQRRGRVPDDEMVEFLASHGDWAFSGPLKAAWLRTLASEHRWSSLLVNAADSTDAEVRCAYLQARIRAGQTEGLLPAAQALWNVGRSQPDACDAVFRWLQQEGGITPGLAWQRIELSMEAGQPRLSLYLARFLPDHDRIWVDRWYEQHTAGYGRLDQAGRWPDAEVARDITEFGLRRLARNDPDRAWHIYQALSGHFSWPSDVRGGLVREIALWSAVNGSSAANERIRAVPVDARDDALLEWRVRYALAREDWGEVLSAVAAMSPAAAGASRWRYWRARALLATNQTARAEELLQELAVEASFYGFLAADMLALPYTVCPEQPAVPAETIDSLAMQPGFERALELRKAGIDHWSRSEWSLAARRLDQEGLRAAAGLAVREQWPDMAIFALGDSGDQRWYEWRFPLDFHALVEANASAMNLDPSWVMGLMRSESAMAESALSSAGARGLMQVTPGTARQLAKRHGYSYTGPQQLMRADDNVRFGTTYMRELSDRFGNNPVLVSGAYNAGPGAVERWLKNRPSGDPAIWIETLPYYETRDYIPRVLAFATLYDWRLQRPVSRISSRMPAFDSGAGSGTMHAGQTAEVVCRITG